MRTGAKSLDVCLASVLLVWPLVLSAACPKAGDFGGPKGILLTRDSPKFEALFVKASANTVLEQRTATRDGTERAIRIQLLNGIWAIERREAGQTITMDYGPTFDMSRPNAIGDVFETSVTLRIDGKRIATGTFRAEVTDEKRLKIGRCRYDTLVVRRTTKLPERPALKNEALYHPGSWPRDRECVNER